MRGVDSHIIVGEASCTEHVRFLKRDIFEAQLLIAPNLLRSKVDTIGDQALIAYVSSLPSHGNLLVAKSPRSQEPDDPLCESSRCVHIEPLLHPDVEVYAIEAFARSTGFDMHGREVQASNRIILSELTGPPNSEGLAFAPARFEMELTASFSPIYATSVAIVTDSGAGLHLREIAFFDDERGEFSIVWQNNKGGVITAEQITKCDDRACVRISQICEQPHPTRRIRIRLRHPSAGDASQGIDALQLRGKGNVEGLREYPLPQPSVFFHRDPGTNELKSQNRTSGFSLSICDPSLGGMRSTVPVLFEFEVQEIRSQDCAKGTEPIEPSPSSALGTFCRGTFQL